jgi:hypothetical protein
MPSRIRSIVSSRSISATAPKIVSINLNITFTKNTIVYPDPTINALAVETVMESVITRNIFTTTGGDITAKGRAEVVARSVDVLADFEA